MVAIDEKLAALPEDDPQRGELSKQRLEAMLQFNAAVLKQNASNLIAMPATKLTNEHALAQASDASQLKELRGQVEAYNKVLEQVQKIKTEEPAELRTLRAMRMVRSVQGGDNVFLKKHIQDYYGSDLDQELAFEDAMGKEGERPPVDGTSSSCCAKRRADRAEDKVKDLKSKLKRSTARTTLKTTRRSTKKSKKKAAS